MKTYKVTHLKGIIGDFAQEWWTDEDRAKHEVYIKKLKAAGEYLKPETITVSLVENPLYDSRSLTATVESAHVEFLDFSQAPENSIMINPTGNVYVATSSFEKVTKQWKDLYEEMEYQMIYGKPSFKP